MSGKKTRHLIQYETDYSRTLINKDAGLFHCRDLQSLSDWDMLANEVKQGINGAPAEGMYIAPASKRLITTVMG